MNSEVVMEVPEVVQPGEARALPFKVFVIGASGSGKSTFAALLAARLGVRVGETSGALMKEAAALMKEVIGDVSEDEYLEYYKSKSDTARVQLIVIGDLMTRLLPTCLIDGATKNGAAIIVGVRRKVELEGWFQPQFHYGSNDVVVEIEGGNDPDFELTGWFVPHKSFVRYVVPAKDASWPAKADAIAEQLLEKALDLCSGL